MYKEGFALNNLQWLTYYKNQPTCRLLMITEPDVIVYPVKVLVSFSVSLFKLISLGAYGYDTLHLSEFLKCVEINSLFNYLIDYYR